MDINARIKQLMIERNWTEYRLAIESNLAHSTIATLFKRGTQPSFATIEAICKALNITLSQFFTPNGEPIILDTQQRRLLDKISNLSPKGQIALENLIDDIIDKKREHPDL